VPDFFALHGAPPFEWCHCVAWEVPTWNGWGERTAEENRALRERLFAAGRHDGYLLYVNDAVAGWCQCGPRDGWPKLAMQFGLAPDPGAWAVTCFCIRPEYRRQGLAGRLLRAVLGDLRRRGVSRVEGFPRPSGDHEDGEVWTGPFALFEHAGFKVVKDTERRLVVALDLAQPHAGAGGGGGRDPLARYLDAAGRLTQWPAKRSLREHALAYLAGKVASGRQYTEAEINHLLGEWHTFGDPALLRRELYDNQLLARTKDGARYWRGTG
jgi:ribosomal protein S18 acetylase RimI-like enzyme